MHERCHARLILFRSARTRFRKELLVDTIGDVSRCTDLTIEPYKKKTTKQPILLLLNIYIDLSR